MEKTLKCPLQRPKTLQPVKTQFDIIASFGEYGRPTTVYLGHGQDNVKRYVNYLKPNGLKYVTGLGYVPCVTAKKRERLVEKFSPIVVSRTVIGTQATRGMSTHCQFVSPTISQTSASKLKEWMSYGWIGPKDVVIFERGTGGYDRLPKFVATQRFKRRNHVHTVVNVVDVPMEYCCPVLPKIDRQPMYVIGHLKQALGRQFVETEWPYEPIKNPVTKDSGNPWVARTESYSVNAMMSALLGLLRPFGMVNLGVNMVADLNLGRAFTESGVADAISSMFEAISRILVGFEEFMPTLKKYLTILFVVGGLLLVLWHLPSESLLRTFILSICAGIFTVPVLEVLKASYPELLGGVARVQSIGVFKPAALIAVVATTAFGWDVPFFESHVKPAITMLRDLKFGTHKIEDQLNELWSMTTEFLNAVFGLVGLPKLFMSINEVHDWVNSCWEFRLKCETTTAPMSRAVADHYNTLMRRGLALLKNYSKQRNVGDAISKTLSMMSNLSRSLGAAFEALTSDRAEPFCLLLYGLPGIGKSWLVKEIHRRAVAKFVSKEEMEAIKWDDQSLMFTPDGGDFEEGYYHQFTYMLDDFMQFRKTIGEKNSDVAKIIRFVNPAKCNMPMAFEGKGKVFFTSKLLLLTTNLKAMKSEMEKIVIEPEAVSRRMSSWIMTVKPEFTQADGVKIDPRKAVEERLRHPPGTCPDMWWFQNYDPLTGEPAKVPSSKASPLTLSELLDEFVIPGIKKNLDDFERGIISSTADLKALFGITDEDPVASERTCVNAVANTVGGIVNRAVEYVRSEIQPIDDIARVEIGHTRVPAQYNLLDFYNDVNLRQQRLDLELQEIRRREEEGRSWWNIKWLRANREARKWAKYFDDSFREIRLDLRYAYETGISHNPWIILGAALSMVGVATLISILGREIARLLTSAFNFSVAKGGKYVGACATAISRRADVLKMFRKEDFEVVDGKVVVNVDTLKRAVARVESSGPIPEVGGNKTTSDVSRVVEKNVLEFMAFELGTWKRMGTALMLANRVVYYPYHFDTKFKDPNVKAVRVQRVVGHSDSKPQLVAEMDRVEINLFLERSAKHVKKHEIVVRDVPWNGFPSVIKFFPTAKQMCKVKDLVDIAVVKWEFDTANKVVRSYSNKTVGLAQDFEKVLDGTDCYDACRVISYDSRLSGGDCGSLVFRLDSGSQSACLIAAHIAGKPSLRSSTEHRGFATLLCRDELAEYADMVSPFMGVVEAPPVEEFLDCEDFDMPLEDENFVPVGRVKKEFGKQHVSEQSRKLETNFNIEQVFGPPTRAPALLSLGGEPNPMVMALGKYTGQARCLPRREICRAANDAFDDFFCVTDKHQQSVRLLTNEEAVTGVCGTVRLANPINRTSSPGFPHNLKGKGIQHKTKKYFLGDGEFDFSSPDTQVLFSQVDEIIRRANMGERMLTIYTDFLKDELRPHDRVRQGKTRLISGAPLAYIIACRRLFLHFVHAFEHFRLPHRGTESIVGINPYKEYNDLFGKMSQVGTKWFAGDFSSYDGSEQPDVHDHIFAVIAKWYGFDAQNNRARLVLLSEVSNSYHLGGKFNNRRNVYMWIKSLPSGHPLTTIINTMYNMIVFRYAFNKLSPNLPWEGNVVGAYYGDDNAHCLSNKISEVFNMETVTPVLAELGLAYTDESKSSGSVKYKDWSEISLLKRRFNLIEVAGVEHVVGALDIISILEMVYWWRKSGDMTEKKAMQQDADTFLREMSLHGFEVWKEYVPLFREKMLEYYNVNIADSATSEYERWLNQFMQTIESDYIWASPLDEALSPDLI